MCRKEAAVILLSSVKLTPATRTLSRVQDPYQALPVPGFQFCFFG